MAAPTKGSQTVPVHVPAVGAALYEWNDVPADPHRLDFADLAAPPTILLPPTGGLTLNPGEAPRLPAGTFLILGEVLAAFMQGATAVQVDVTTGDNAIFLSNHRIVETDENAPLTPALITFTTPTSLGAEISHDGLPGSLYLRLRIIQVA